MNKVFQTIIDKDNGNCLQAAIASLLNMKLEDVPHFIEFGDMWISEFQKFLIKNNYEIGDILYNVKHQRLLWGDNEDCFNDVRFAKNLMLTKANLKKHGGVDGYFYAGVISPMFGNINNKWYNQHAVIIDSDMNIIHDPNPNYSNLIKYPLADVIKCNGIVDVQLIKKNN